MRIHGTLDGFHELDGSLTKFFNQETFLSNPDSMLSRTYIVARSVPNVMRGRFERTSAIESDGALNHSMDKLAHYFELFLIPER